MRIQKGPKSDQQRTAVGLYSTKKNKIKCSLETFIYKATQDRIWTKSKEYSVFIQEAKVLNNFGSTFLLREQ